MCTRSLVHTLTHMRLNSYTSYKPRVHIDVYTGMQMYIQRYKTSKNVHPHTHTHTLTRPQRQINTYAHTCTCISHTYSSTHRRTYTYIHTHSNTHAHKHSKNHSTHTHTQIYKHTYPLQRILPSDKYKQTQTHSCN